ncbi:hypothetical protein SNE40_015842 [Patella caerulea]|uniref:Uncharacterized protein n=1 Tax=Patella caerulea TaxID=87958 RepID=A0AAN8JKR5_PATCE
MAFYWILVTLVAIIVNNVTGCPQQCRSCGNNVADCSKAGISSPPKNFAEGINTINLNENRFSVLGPRSFQRLSSVEILKVRGNRIRVIRSAAFRNLRNLMTLDLADNQIVKVYGRGFLGMRNLETLTLSNNRLRSSSRIFSYTRKLYQLNLAFNAIKKVGDGDFSNCPNIHQIDLRGNQITSIHRNAFKNLVNLRTLFLNSNPIANLPDLNFGSQVLNLLDFSECQLTRIPQTLPASIGDLRFNKNKLTRINQSDLANVTGLKMITLNYNEIDIVEYFALGNALGLKEVWLRGNKLVYIPRGLPDSVTQLHMGSNTVYQIEGRLFSNRSQLEFLDIMNNNVVNISSQAFNGLKKLRSLNFQGNQLQDIKPGTFTNLNNLTSLLLANNPIATIHDGAFGNLGNLTTLTINYNPEEDVFFEENFLEAMPNLETLDLMASPGMTKNLLRLLDDTNLVMEHVKEVSLTYNNLHKLAPIFREVFPNIEKVTLDGNAWICDDKLLWLKRWIDSASSYVVFYEYSPPKCETPYGLNGREIHQVPDRDFVAPDENMLNDFPYWLIEEEFKDFNEDQYDRTGDDKVKDKQHHRTNDKVKDDEEVKKLKVGQKVEDQERNQAVKTERRNKKKSERKLSKNDKKSSVKKARERTQQSANNLKPIKTAVSTDSKQPMTREQNKRLTNNDNIAPTPMNRQQKSRGNDRKHKRQGRKHRGKGKKRNQRGKKKRKEKERLRKRNPV